MDKVKVGDYLEVDPYWNETTGSKYGKFPKRSKVHGIQSAISQTGVLFLVKDLGKEDHWLDAAWFIFPGE